MRRSALIIAIPLIGGMAIAACNAQPGTAVQSNVAATAAPGAAAAVANGDVAGKGAIAAPALGTGVSQTGAAAIPDVPFAVQVVAENGKYVVRSNPDDKPLYTYDRDAAGKSNCNDSCAAAWPPVAAPADAKPIGDWTIVTRADGSHQWAFGGKPVYSFKNDAEGVASGDGTGGVWHLLPTIAAK